MSCCLQILTFCSKLVLQFEPFARLVLHLRLHIGGESLLETEKDAADDPDDDDHADDDEGGHQDEDQKPIIFVPASVFG